MRELDISRDERRIILNIPPSLRFKIYRYFLIRKLAKINSVQKKAIINQAYDDNMKEIVKSLKR